MYQLIQDLADTLRLTLIKLQGQCDAMKPLEAFGLDLSLVRSYLQTFEEVRGKLNRWPANRLNYETRAAEERIGELKKLERRFLTSDWLWCQIGLAIDELDDIGLEDTLLPRYQEFARMTGSNEDLRTVFLALMANIKKAQAVVANRRKLVESRTPAKFRPSKADRAERDRILRASMKGRGGKSKKARATA